MRGVPVRLKESGEIVGHVSQRLVRKLRFAPALRECKRQLNHLRESFVRMEQYAAHQRRLAANPAVRAFRAALAREEQ